MEKRKKPLKGGERKTEKGTAFLGRSAAPGNVHVHPEGFFVVYNALYVIFRS
jgi:hypothetical protein